jgi:hypothetical protein
MGQDTEDVRGRLGVGHLGERLGHTTQSCGQLAPPRQVQGGQLIDQRRRSLVGNSYGSSTNQHGPDEKLGHAAMPKARDRRAKMVAALTRLQQTSDTTSSISRPRSVLLWPGQFGRMRRSPWRRWVDRGRRGPSSNAGAGPIGVRRSTSAPVATSTAPSVAAVKYRYTDAILVSRIQAARLAVDQRPRNRPPALPSATSSPDARATGCSSRWPSCSGTPTHWPQTNKCSKDVGPPL